MKKVIVSSLKEAETIISAKSFGAAKVYGCIDQNNNFLGYLKAQDFSKFWKDKKIVGAFHNTDGEDVQIVTDIIFGFTDTIRANWIVFNAYLEEVKEFLVEVEFPANPVQKKHKYLPYLSASPREELDVLQFKVNSNDMTLLESVLFIDWLRKVKQMSVNRKISHGKMYTWIYFSMRFPYEIVGGRDLEIKTNELLEEFENYLKTNGGTV